MTNKLTKALFLIYLAILVYILIFKLGVQFSYMDNRQVNLIPFNGHLTFNAEVILNTLVFVPFGVYVSMLFTNWSIIFKIFIFLFTSFVIEALQYFFRIGAFDITDIITNTLGGFIGFILLKMLTIIFKNKAHKLVNFMAVLGTAFLISVLVLLKFDMLPIKYH